MRSAGSGGGPLVDGWVVPGRPYDLLENGKQNLVNVMVGGLADEYFGLQHLSPEISEAELTEYLVNTFGEEVSEIRTAYSKEIVESPLSARKVIAGDNGFILNSRMWGRLVESRGSDAYVYYFSRPPPVFRLYVPDENDLNSDGGGRTLGAYHSGELAYVFNNLDIVGLGWEPADRQLSDTIADYWVNFAATGDPNGPGLPVWPKYNSNLDMVQILDTPVKTSVHPRKLELDRMERIYMNSR
jgi:para-nitrobenzyl esterase